MKGWNPQKPTKLDGNDTTTLSRHPYILCHFANLHNAIKFVFIHYGIRPGLLRLDILGINPPNILFRPSTAHALHSFSIQARQIISAMLSIATTLYIAATHNITHSPCTQHVLHTQHYPLSTTHHNAFCNPPPLHTTNKHKVYLCRWRQIGTRCRNGVTTSACRDWTLKNQTK